jgi:AraC family transcriptional regulator
MDTYIDTAIEYIQTFFSANITIDDICGEINVSPFHFIRTFKQKIGVSPHQYLLNIRIEKAKELLCMRQHSVAETAMLCGFLSLPHFSSTFKTATGYSPSEYKKVFLK